jgi:NADH-quinone oxidoreductase subunit D
MSHGRQTMILNLGPQHPSTHGVLRVIVELEGERIVSCTPDIGYLHRGIEKLMEAKTWHQCLPLTDRLDYLAGPSNNLGYCLAVETLLGIEAPPRAQAVRVVVVELARISSHLFWLGTHAHDLGAMTPLFYAFRERERVMDLFEMAGGSRLFPCYFRIGGLAADLPEGFVEAARSFATDLPGRTLEYERLLTDNPIWQGRTKGVGAVSVDEVLDWSWSGPIARGSGLNWDLRKSNPYCGYEKYEFEVPLGSEGDTFDRYRVRIEEMRQSARIILQALNMPEGPVNVLDPKISLPPKERVYTDIEALIHHFLIIEEGIKPPKGEVYVSIEAPKGEMGFYLVSDGGARPYRVKNRAPSFINLSALPRLAEGRLLSDLIALIGTIDIVLADVDR